MTSESQPQAQEFDPFALTDPFGQPWRRPNSPYPGIRPFEPYESTVFRGRDVHISVLMQRLRNRRFVAVIGNSGCGKSSLVRAGLIPRLDVGIRNERTMWRAAIMLPGQGPLLGLASALLTALRVPAAQIEAEAPQLAERLGRSPFGLTDVLRERPIPADTNVLLLVDQFEEIFQYRAANEVQRRESDLFVQTLIQLSLAREFPIYVVMTMRSDFLGQCALFPDLPKLLNGDDVGQREQVKSQRAKEEAGNYSCQYLTPNPNDSELREAIIDPALEFESDVEPALVERLLTDLKSIPEEADQLPLLQHALMRTWEERCRRVGGATDSRNSEEPILLQDYLRVGEEGQIGKDGWNPLQTVLGRHLDSIYGPDENTPEAERRRGAVERLFRRITLSYAGRQTRDPAPFAEVAQIERAARAFGANQTSAGPEADAVADADLRHVIEAFRAAGCYFMRPYTGEIQPATRLDITHEVEYRQWPRLKGWMEREAEAHTLFDRLYRDARRWDPNRPETEQPVSLWTGPTLTGAEQMIRDEKMTAVWASRYQVPDDPGAGNYSESHYRKVTEFLQASRRAENARAKDKERRLKHDKGLAMAAFVIVLLFTLSLSLANKALEARKAELDKTNGKLTEANALLAGQKAELARANGKLTDANTLLAGQKTDLDNANGKLTQANQALVARKAELAQANGKLTEANGTLKMQKVELDNANGKLTQANQALVARKAELAQANGKLTEANGTLKMQKVELDNANGKLTAANTLLAGQKADLDKANGKLTAANTLLAGQKADLDKANGKLTAANKQADALNRMLLAFGITLDPGQERTGLAKVKTALDEWSAVTTNGQERLPLPPAAQAALTLAVAAAERALPLPAGKIPGRRVTDATRVRNNTPAQAPEANTLYTTEIQRKGLTAFSPDGGRVVTLAGNQSLLLYDANGGRLLGRGDLPPSAGANLLTAVAIDPVRATVTALDKNYIYTWNTSPVASDTIPNKLHWAEQPRIQDHNCVHLTYDVDGNSIPIPDWLGLFTLLRGHAHDRHKEDLIALAYGSDGSLAVACYAGVWLWDPSGQPHVLRQQPKDTHRGVITDVAVDSLHHRFATAGYDGTVRIWSQETGASLYLLQPYSRLQKTKTKPKPIQMIRFTRDGRFLVALDADRLAVWDLNSPTADPIVRPDFGGARTFAIAPDDSHRLLLGKADGSVEVWSFPTASGASQVLITNNVRPYVVATNVDNAAAVASVAFSPDGGRLLALTSTGDAVVWGRNDVAPLKSLLTGPVRQALYASDRQRILVAEQETLSDWDGATSRLNGRRQIPELSNLGNDARLKYSSDGKTCVLITAKGEAQFVRLSATIGAIQAGNAGSNLNNSVQPLAQSPSFPKGSGGKGDAAGTQKPVAFVGLPDSEPVLDAQFSPTGDRIAILTQSAVTVYAASDPGTPMSQITVPSAGIDQMNRARMSACAFSSTGQQIVILKLIPIMGPDVFCIYRSMADGRTWALQQELPNPHFYPTALALSDESNLLGVAYADRGPVLIDTTAQQTANRAVPPADMLGDENAAANVIAFSGDGKLLAAGGADGRIRIWETRPASAQLATGPPDNRQTQTGRAPKYTIQVHFKGIRSLQFNGDGTQLLSASDDGTVKVSTLDLDAFETALKYLQANLSPGVSGE